LLLMLLFQYFTLILGFRAMAAVLEMKEVVTEINGKVLHNHVNLEIHKGEILGIVGGSGSGKSVLLKVILGLMPFKSGTIQIFGVDPFDPRNQQMIHQRSSMLFQSGALFSSLTVAENIQLPMIELAHMDPELATELALIKIDMVGLPADAANKYPSELSGGMVKRAALARALAIDADLLFLDEPTAGLDPISADGFDHLLKELQRTLGLTVVMVTHDLDSLYAICDRVAVLVDQKITAGTIPELLKHEHPWIQDYFQGPRGRAIIHNTKEK
jgi:phospholipid/cholesterol/gamma-HCH transport system ATP-binding protein